MAALNSRAQTELDKGPTPLEPRGDEAGHILIVDDIKDNRAILARRFQRRGYQVSEADCGRAALEMIAAETFDLVLLDVMMPDIDGVEVLKELRGKFNSAALPVIMVTARSQSHDIVQALELGADDYITKPVDFSVALARVRTQLARRRAELQLVEAAEELMRSNETLEQRVEERTSELVEINRQLKVEIAQREQSEAQSKYLAYHDALTGLPNRVLFRESLEQALKQVASTGATVSVLFVDLDGFKGVNDTLGHSVGDGLLKLVAARLRDLLSEDDHIARLGGDEFAILHSGKHAIDESASIAARIVDAVAEPCVIDDNQIIVGASVGVAICETGKTDPEDLLRNADLAMYKAKSEGRGTFRHFDPEMDIKAQARRSLELDMRRALAAGEFRVFFQPIVNLKTREVVCFEALLRWYHETRGVISPAEFIPVAEDTGVIVPLGEWVIREACREASRWKKPIRVAVNLSPVQFTRGKIVPTVVSALAASGLPAERLELEITETVILDKTERNISVLHQLREIGVKISMDDFGTGYSSLSYLRSFEFDKIKIDQSFVRDIERDKNSRAIVSAITGLGTCFGVYTTAEGVETEEQLRMIMAEGCTEVQGRLFSMPVPAGEVENLLEKLRERR